jgi:hypothetical protein
MIGCRCLGCGVERYCLRNGHDRQLPVECHFAAVKPGANSAHLSSGLLFHLERELPNERTVDSCEESPAGRR